MGGSYVRRALLMCKGLVLRLNLAGEVVLLTSLYAPDVPVSIERKACCIPKCRFIPVSISSSCAWACSRLWMLWSVSRAAKYTSCSEICHRCVSRTAAILSHCSTHSIMGCMSIPRGEASISIRRLSSRMGHVRSTMYVPAPKVMSGSIQVRCHS